jgi:hypothetical protein
MDFEKYLHPRYLLGVAKNIGAGWLLFVIMNFKSIDGNKFCVIHGKAKWLMATSNIIINYYFNLGGENVKCNWIY